MPLHVRSSDTGLAVVADPETRTRLPCSRVRNKGYVDDTLSRKSSLTPNSDRPPSRPPVCSGILDNALGLGHKPQHVYSVQFSARELWGEQAAAKDTLYLELFEDYIIEAHGV